MRLFVGIDGGQSSTTALIGDENGKVLGVGTAGPCNHVGAREGARKLTQAVSQSLASACAQAGLAAAETSFEAACVGMSGGPEDKQLILSKLLLARTLVVTTDAAIALAGATGGEAGAVTIAGTGSMAFGRNESGRNARAGGWGYIFGDEGSGFDIVRQALRAALRFEEGWGPATILRGMLLDATGCKTANDALHAFYTLEWPRPRIAAMAPTVDEAALQGDPVASAILRNAGQQLASLAASVRAQLWGGTDRVFVAFAGGVFRSNLVRAVYCQITELAEGNRCGPPLYGPAAGALLEAYRCTGLHVQLHNVPEFKC
jgi:N-acetylglucosamine kinase